MSTAKSDVTAAAKWIANLSERVEQTNADPESIVIKHDEASRPPGDDADRPDYSRQSDRERTHLLLIDDVTRGLADIAAGRHVDAGAALGELQDKRAAVEARRQRGDA